MTTSAGVNRSACKPSCAADEPDTLGVVCRTVVALVLATGKGTRQSLRSPTLPPIAVRRTEIESRRMATSEKFILVYILGAGHCGSTLLNLLLNGHSQILGLSEVETIGRYITAEDEVSDNPLHTDFWQEVKQCYETNAETAWLKLDIAHPSRKQLCAWSAEEMARWVRTNELLFACIAKKSGARILVDASKSWQRLYLLRRSGLFNIKVIHLVRDGRAVINSYIRKYGDFNIAIRRWMSPSILAFYLRTKFQKKDWINIKYEKVACETEKTLQNICIFLGIKFEPRMLSYRKSPYVGVGGNRMRDQRDECIFLDERWQYELGRSHLFKFVVIGGLLNKYYGY